MEMDCWQYWDAIRDQADRDVLGMNCLKCKHRFSSTFVKKRAYSNNAFRSCPKCGGEMRFYKKRKN